MVCIESSVACLSSSPLLVPNCLLAEPQEDYHLFYPEKPGLTQPLVSHWILAVSHLLRMWELCFHSAAP